MRDNLKFGIQICNKWSQVCQTMTSQFWKNYHLNQWQGPAFVPEKLNLLGKRLEEVRHGTINFLIGLLHACANC